MFATFVEPSEAAIEERERARLLSGVLLVIVVFGVAATAAHVALVPILYAGTFVRAFALAMLTIAWALSRTGHDTLAAWLAIAVPIVTMPVQALVSPSDITWWAFMLISPLFATMFLPTRVAVAVSAFTALVAALILFVAHPPGVSEWFGPIAFHLVYLPLLITAAWHRTRVEQKRRDELAARDVALLEVRRMEAIGRLAGGVAHDFNNLLTVVVANAQLLHLRAKEEHVIASAQEIIDAADRASALTRQLLAFARREPHLARSVNLVRVVDDLEPMIRRLLGDHVKLEVVRPQDAAVVVADATQLEQVVMNLVANARDAMPRGGKLTVTIGVAGDGVTLAVRDTGVGMDEATRARIFEPFFTTKSGTGGTGLGLATTHGIVKQCGGSITVDSEPGKGSELRVTLPRSTELAVLPSTPTPSPVVFPPLEVRVLLVEDDAGIRRALHRAIESHGVTVTLARSAEEALACTSPYDVLVTDVVMPGMHGPELVAKLRARRPSLPVVFISANHAVPGLASMDDTVVLDKPLRIDTLMKRLRELAAVRV